MIRASDVQHLETTIFAGTLRVWRNELLTRNARGAKWFLESSDLALACKRIGLDLIDMKWNFAALLPAVLS